MTLALDHLVWGAPDLDAGAALLERFVGVRPARGGSHAGFGTRNSLLGAGTDLYIEVMAPDPDQLLAGTLGASLAALPRPGLVTFAVRTDDLGAYAGAASALGLQTRGPVPMGRTRPDGLRLDWKLLFVDDPDYGGAIPFAIDWCGAPHPSGTTPDGCVLRDFAVLHRRPAPLASIFRALGIPVPVRAAAHPGFVATLDTPAGEAVLLAP